MEETIRLSPLPPELRSQDFAFLREEALGVIRQLAAETWTDHNLHDPGITLLEALCYALTEGGLRSDMDIRDLLASGVSTAPAEFFTAVDVLPTEPLTAADLRLVLLDHPLVRDAWVAPLTPAPLGRYSVLLEFADEALNANTFSITVTPPVLGTDYQVDLAFPYWDEPEVVPLRADQTLLSVAFDGPPGNPWRPVEGSTAHFARALLDFQPPGGGPIDTLPAWIVAQVTTPLDNPLVELVPILEEVATAIATLGDNTAADQTLFKQYNRRVSAAHEATRTVRRFLRDYRNLGEDFVAFQAVRLQEVAITGILEVGDEADVERLLTDIFLTLDAFISPETTWQSLNDRLAAPVDTAIIYEGPLLDSGFLAAQAPDTPRPLATVYVSDILRLIFQLRNAQRTDVQAREEISTRRIIAVRNLSLSNYLDNRTITSEARDCLRLVQSDRHVPRLSPTKSRIVFYRNGLETAYDIARVLEAFTEEKAAAASTAEPGTADLPVPGGETFPVSDYYSVQNDLPLVYGVGEAGLPDHASPARRGQARQLQGYLFFFEQLLAGHLAQLAQVNAFFSADPDLDATLFHQPLYELPGAEALLRAFEPTLTTWEAFQADPLNPYRRLLRTAAETEDQFLDRRNRALDHLLARQGEEVRDLAALVYRQAAAVPNAAALNLEQLLAVQQTRRRGAARQLIRDKAAFYYDLPDLNRARDQSFGNLAWRRPAALTLQPTPTGYTWQWLGIDGVPLLQGASEVENPVQARRAAAQALALGTNDERYTILLEGGGERRLEIRPAPGHPPVAVSVDTYASDPLAESALQDLAEDLIDDWIAHALTPLEWRLYHLLRIRVRERRRLLRPLSDYWDIFDEPDADPIIEKRFRLWSEPAFAGDELLASVDNYPGPDDPTATADAQAAIRRAIEGGVLEENYLLEEPAPGAFQVALLEPNGSIIARSPGTFATAEAAQASAVRIRQHLYRSYSLEGFYLVEHLLLHPPDEIGAELVIPESEDPYSFQVTLVFPSGYARDFSVPEGVRTPVPPDRFRDEEFRRYAERTIRKACPAHIFPRMLWVDRAPENTVLTGDEPCFDLFEARYREWLTAWFTDEADESFLGPPRDALVATLNAIYLDQAD